MRILTSCLLLVLVASPAFAGDKSAPAEPKDMKSLFNGKDLSGWDGDARLWEVKDGVIHGETTKETPPKATPS